MYEKFNAIVDFIIDHLWDYDNSIFYFNDDTATHFKLEAIYNKKKTIFFRNIRTNELKEFNTNNLPNGMFSISHNIRIY